MSRKYLEMTFRCFRFVLQVSVSYTTFCCTSHLLCIYCTTDPQQIEVMEFGLYNLRHTHVLPELVTRLSDCNFITLVLYKHVT